MSRPLAPTPHRWTPLILALTFVVAAAGPGHACPPSCDDSNACTTDSCDAGTDTCLHVPVTDGTGCDDANACTTADACQAGVCVGGPALSCDDANGCTDDICDSGLGCLHANNNAPCSDANLCTGCAPGTCGPVGANDVCNGGVCVGGNTAPGCDACAAVATIPPLGGTFVGTTFGTSALTGGCGLTGLSPERVYVWIPDTGGQATISTCGPGTTYDTVVYLRNGDCGAGAEEACNDNFAGCTISDGSARGSTITPLVVAGQPYYIVVDGKNGAAGKFTLTVKPASICGNNVREGLEQCDGTANSACCIGKVCQPCADDCTCTPPPDGLPDLAPDLRDISVEFGATVASGDVAEGCAERTTGVDLLRFGVRSRNLGTADFYLGPSLCPLPCSSHPLAVCANPEFVCSPAAGHNHAHYTNYARYDLLDSTGTALVVGHKQGFCLRDDDTCTNPRYDCETQGLSAGCFDDYYSGLGCQYLDITGIPGGSYTLRVTIDPFQRISELNEGNNVVTIPVTIPVQSTTTTTTSTTSSTTSSTSTSESTTSTSETSTSTSSSTSTTETSTSTSSTTTTSTPESSTTTSTPSTTETSTSVSTTVAPTSSTSSSSSSTSSTSPSTVTSSSTPTSTSVTTSTTSSSSTTSSTSSTSSTSPPLPTTTSSPTTSTTLTTTTTLPPTDGCAAPIVVPADGGVFLGTTTGLGAQSGTCAPTGIAPERVYQWTPSASGVATIQTCGAEETTFDTVLYVRESSCTDGAELGCNDDTPGCAIVGDGTTPGRGSYLAPTVVAGHTYFIVVDGWSVGQQGSFALTVVPPGGTPPTTTTTLPPTTTTSTTVTTSTTTTSTVPPGSCGAPIVLPPEGGAITGATRGRSALAGTCAYTNAAPERVYQWTAPRSGTATIQTCGGRTAFDTVLYVRQVACTSGTQVGCNDDTQGCGTTLDGAFPHRGSKVTTTVTAGRTYFIVVDGYATARGTFQLTVTPPPVENTTVHHRRGGKVRPRALGLVPPAQLR